MKTPNSLLSVSVLMPLWFIFLGSCTASPTRNMASHPSSGEWQSYASDYAATKFSHLASINRGNVSRLKVAWQWDSLDNQISGYETGSYEATPIFIEGMLITSTSLSQIAALNPETGKTIWYFDPKAYESGYPGNFGFVHRGVAYWSDGLKKRILIGTNDGNLLSLDAMTGKLDSNFGNNGRIDLTAGYVPPELRRKYGVTSPPVICGDTVIVGSSIPDFFYRTLNPKGDVRGFDIATGRLKWTFHTIPVAGEEGFETWLNNSGKDAGNANVWAPMSVDRDLNSVYLPVSTPTNDYYGGERPGNGLYGESLVSLNCENGAKNWHYQLIHHGLWDYDPPSAPILMDIAVNGRPIKAVVQTTKQAFAYVFDRITGKPVWPIVERPVAQSSVPGEKSSPTQPFPTLPKPFDTQGFTDEAWTDPKLNIPPALKTRAIQYFEANGLNYGPLFTPPTEKQSTASLPGAIGGASWAGAAFDPTTKMLFIPSITSPFVLGLQNDLGSNFKYSWKVKVAKYLDAPDAPSLTKPPYGRITAINMNTGEHVWTTAIGRGPKDDPLLQGLKLNGHDDMNFPEGDLGWPRRIHVLATSDLLFAAQSGKYQGVNVHLLGPNQKAPIPYPNSIVSHLEDDEPLLRALDPRTGKVLAKIQIPANAWGAPMTYLVNGKQYVVMAVGGANLPAKLIALSIDGK